MTAVEERSKATELEAAEQALKDAEQAKGKDSPDISPELERLADLYHRDGLYAKAELLLRRKVDVLARAEQPLKLAEALSRLGMLYRIEGKLDDAESVYLRCLACAEQADDNARLHAERLCCLAGLYMEKKEYAQSEELLKKATVAFQTAFGQQSCYSRLCSMALAAVCQRLGKTGEADENFERSRGDGKADAGTPGDDRALLELAQTYYGQGRFADVETILNQILLSDEERLWPEHPRAGEMLHERGELFRAQGRFEDAEHAYRRALDIRMAVLGPKHPEVAASAMALATMYLSQNRCVDAEQPLKCALKTRVRAFGVEHPGVAACIETFAIILKRTKRVAIATKLEARARDIRSRLVWQADKAANANKPNV